MVKCLLCLESNQDALNYIKVESTQWEDLCINNLIDKYLWPMDTITSQSCLCSICWEELADFHKFYTRIEIAHNDFKSIIKTETDPLKEDIKPKDFILEYVLEPEIIISQTLDSAIVIKQEHEETLNDYSDNDNYVDIPDDDHEIAKNDSDDSDDDIPLIHRINSMSSAKARSKSKQSGSTDKDDDDCPNPDPLQSNSARKSYYKPKTNRLEHDKFLQKHFKITCNKCHQPFETFRVLSKHYSTEHNERGFVICCETKFFNRTLLFDHINYHLDPESFKCVHCGKVFTKRRCLQEHIKLHEEMKYKCDICEKKFVKKSKLDRHKLTHLPEEEKKFPCDECGKLFADEYALTHHQRVVHLNIYAKVCEICGQTMPDNNSFKRHMEKHDPTLPTTSAKCDECGLILSGKRSLKRHKDLKHPVGGKREYACHICMKVSPNMKALKKHIQCTHVMGYNYKCTMCEKAFKRLDNFKAHMSTHTGTPLYHCPWCPKEFNSNGNMHSHRKKVHPIEWEEARRKKYSGNLPPDFTPPTSNSQYLST